MTVGHEQGLVVLEEGCSTSKSIGRPHLSSKDPFGLCLKLFSVAGILEAREWTDLSFSLWKVFDLLSGEAHYALSRDSF